MGYLTPCNTLAVTGSGTYEIGPIETRCAGPQVLQIPGAASVNQGKQYIYLEYRNGKGTVGSDSKSPAGVYFHASAELGGVLAPTPPDPTLPYANDPFYIHAPLTTANSSWTESTSGATFTLTSLGATASVQVAIPGGGDGGAPKCVDGTTPPSSPMCGAVDGGTGGTGGSTGMDASTDVGKDGAGGSAGTGGAAGSAGSSGTAGASGAVDAGRDTGTAGTGGAAGSGGSSGGAGSGGTAGKGGTGGSGGGGTSGASGTSGSGGSAGTGATGGSGGTSGGAGSGTGGSGKGGTGGSTGGSTTGNPPPADDGCSCSVPGRGSSTSTPSLLAGLAALIPALRRRARRSSR
jgi:hypothetical protein